MIPRRPAPRTPEAEAPARPLPSEPAEIDVDELDDVVGGAVQWPGGQPAPIPVPPPFTGPRQL